jgi:segregation and condensation protein A
LNSISQTYNIKIELFEGPFDLLLFFIQRDELDINDIPITKITDDFLDYIHQLEKLNLDIASEFILTAATLIRIKTKMLLPRKEIDEFGNEIDPRTSLVEKLLEYKNIKSILDDFRGFEEERAKKFKRGNTSKELKKIAQTALIDAELESLSLYKLMKAFDKILKKHEEKKSRKVHTVHFYKYKVKDQKQYISNKLKNKNRLAFNDVFESLENRIHAVITFLALLELLTTGDVKVVLGKGANNFWIESR